jgi:hypothetical protein
MSTIINFISNNALISSLIAAAIIGAVTWIWKLERDRKDSNAIYQFLLDSKSSGGFIFRSTHAIASHTKLTEERVAMLCARHPKIHRNEKEKQSWRLSNDTA